MNNEEKDIRGNIKLYLVLSLILLVFVPIIYLSFLVYKAINPECEYTEKTGTIREPLTDSKFVFENDYAYMINENRGKCAPIFNATPYWLYSAKSYTKDHSQIIKKGTVMNFKQTISMRRYGFFNTLDTGSGPWVLDIIEDDAGVTYILPSSSLIQSQNISVYKDGKKIEFPPVLIN